MLARILFYNWILFLLWALLPVCCSYSLCRVFIKSQCWCVCVLGLCQNFLLFIFPSSAVNCLVKTIANKKTIDFHHNFMHVHLNCTNTQFAFCHMCNNKSCEIYTISTVFFCRGCCCCFVSFFLLFLLVFLLFLLVFFV